jgi:eukaryotic-like serine/threonine-protein kinase
MADDSDDTTTLDGASAPEPADAPRPVLADRYRLERKIADGGMASVWEAHDAVLARTVAIKILHEHLAGDDAFRERFRREAVSAAKLTHPNIVGLYDTGTEGEQVYLVMEFVDGTTLKEVMTDLGQLEPGQAAAIAEKVARGLAYAHQRGVVHRDIKPANILIAADGAVKVADFGIAKAEEADDLTRTGMVLGTAAYVAPEQVCAEPLDGRADLYSLGCVLYEALTGRQPFSGESPVATAAARLEQDAPPLRAVRPDAPRGLEAIVARLLARRPDDRFPDATRAADALVAFAEQDPDQAAALTTALPAVTADRPARESFVRTEGRWLAPVLVLVVGAVAILALGLGTGTLPQLLPGGEDQPAEPDAGPSFVAPAAVAVFDPLGSGEERDHELPNLVDGNDTTTWRTSRYNRPAFGNLKPGVGFYLDLGAAHTVDYVALRTVTPGVTYELRVADEPGADLDAWRPVALVEGAEGFVETAFDEPVTTRYVLVWVTGELPSYGSGYAAEFAAIAVRGEPA